MLVGLLVVEVEEVEDAPMGIRVLQSCKRFVIIVTWMATMTYGVNSSTRPLMSSISN